MATTDDTIRLGVDLNADEAKASARKLRKELVETLSNIDQSKTSATFKKLELSMKEVATKSRETSQEMRELAKKPEVATEKFKEVQAEVSKAEAKVKALNEQLKKMKAIGVKPTTKSYKSLEYDIQQAKETRKYWRSERTKLASSGQAVIPGVESARYKELTAKLVEYNNQLRIGTQRLQEMAQKQGALKTDSSIKGEGEAAEKTTQSLGVLENQKKRTRKANAELGTESDSTKTKLLSESNAGNTLSTTFKFLKGAVRGAWLAMKMVGKGANGIINKIRGIDKGTQDTTASVRNLIKFGLKYFLGLRSIFILYKRIRQAGVEAYKGLASQFPELQKEVDALKVSFFQLKNSLATMAQPILSYLVPAIQTLMSWLVAAMNALANFFAILTGAKYIYKATKNNNALADSIKGTGKAADEANEDIAEYDNLILIQQDKDKSGGGAGAADEYAGAWEKVEAESDFAKALKDAINRGDWEGVGDLFAQKLNGVVNRVDNWINNVLRPEGTKWAERIGKILNGLTAGFDAEKFGQTVADAVNAIFDIANTFLTTYKFMQLGEKVGTAISNFFKKADLKLVGTTLANRLNATIDFLTGLLKKLEFKNIGTKIGTGLKTFLETIKFDDIGANLSNLADGILKSLSGFIEGSQLGKTVGTSINKFLSKINFGELMRDLSELAINILSALADAIETVDWEMVGQAIVDVLKNIDWGRFLTTLLQVALGLLKGIGTALLQIATDPEAMGSIATGLLAIFGAKWLWSKITGIFKSGLTSAISGAAGGISVGGLAKLAGGIALGVGYYDIVGRGAGSVAELIATAIGDDEMAKYYHEFSQGPIQYTVKAFSDAVAAAKEYSETTGKSTLANAWSMMWGGDDVTEIAKQKTAEALRASQKELERAKLGFSKEKGGIGREVTDIEWLAHEWGDTVDQMLQTTDDAWFGMGAKMREFGEMLAPAVEEGRKSLDLFAQDLESFKTDSNHYAEIAKQNAGIYESTTKQAEEASNHYVEIAKQNSGYYDKIQKEMEASSNHYVAIAKANAGIVETETKESLTEVEKASTESFITLTKEADNAGFELVTTFKDANTEVIQSFDGTEQYFETVADGVKKPFGDMGDFFKTTFGTAWEDTVKIFQSNSPEFTTIQDKISGTFTGAINSMIGGINNTLVKPFSTLNNMMAKLKEVSVGGSKIFAGLPSVTNIPTIPKLAQGAVLPPNSPFLAMVGDQKSGTNVEAPLDTIAEALRQVLSERQSTQNPTIVLQLNGNQIAQAVWNEESKRYKQTGVRYRQA